MAGVRLELGNPANYASPAEYIEKHLAPLATELHRMLNEVLDPGSSSLEECSMDMRPRSVETRAFSTIDTLLKSHPKAVLFQGQDYFGLPMQTLRTKQLKVQFSATVYTKSPGCVEFRLMSDTGDIISGSRLETSSLTPVTLCCLLPFQDAEGCIRPKSKLYVVQGRRLSDTGVPVCRRLSLSFVYI